MKKNIFQAIAFAITIIALAACQQAELNRPGEVKVKTASFRAILEDGAPQTKTTLGEKNSEGYYPVFWSENDAIKIVTRQYSDSGGEGTRMVLTSGAGTKEAVFTGEIPEKTDEFLYYYAIYPYHISASIGDASEELGDHYDWELCLAGYLEIPLPSVQKYAPHSFAKDYNPAIAVTKDEVLRFKNICGLLQLNLTGDIKVSKITVEDLGGAILWGMAHTRYRWNSLGETEYLLFIENEIGQGIGAVHNNSDAEIRDRSRITLVCDTPVQLSSEPTDFYLAIPNGQRIWPPLPEALSQGFILTIYDENGKAVYIQKTTEDNTIHRSMVREMPVINVSRKELTDLSANGGANSYIVAPGGTYKFYAGYRGNSVYPVPAAAAVEVLWETKNSTEEAPGTRGIIYDGVYNPETGYISFKTTDTQGNALIAIRDANDNILWSWHIWNTDYNPDAAGATSMVNGSYELMNRDLGAMSSDQVGLTYQWGRKDPFPNTFQYKTSPSDPFNTVVEGSGVGEGTDYAVDYTIEHPTTAITGGIVEWAGPSNRVDLWGKNKTEYDPCPPGWQVMDFDAFQSISHRISGYQLWDYEQSGEFGFIFRDSDPPMFFPYEGNWTNRHINYVGAFGINKDNFYVEAPAKLRPLRCQRSSTVQDIRPVIDLSANGTANSYIVQPDKQYKFKATVKGNSNESVGAIAKVAFGYTTENNSTFSLPDWNLHGDEDVVGNIYLKDGYIYFSTSMDGHHGNSTILAKDFNDNVLWSWHIWCPEENPTSNTYSFDGGDNVTYEMMSLNLGALNNNPGDKKSLGLMYQWGRKDPFLCARAWDSNAQAEFMGTHESVDASAETSTLAYAISHPTAFIEGSTDWLSEPDNGLWGETKTKYDPCPPGWKVPARPVWSSAHAVVAEFDPQYKGLTMGGKWYPAAGYRNSTSFNLHNVGLEGHYWYASPHDAGTAHAFYFYYQSSTSTDIDVNGHSDSKAQANSVRCVRE